MKLNESFSYAGSDVETVYALITDQDFRTESCANQGSTDFAVTVEPKGDGATVTVVRTQAADLPEFVKKLTGSTVKVKQTEVWGGPDGDGNRKADIKVSIIGQPAEMVGKATLRPNGNGSEFELNGNRIIIARRGLLRDAETLAAGSALRHNSRSASVDLLEHSVDLLRGVPGEVPRAIDVDMKRYDIAED